MHPSRDDLAGLVFGTLGEDQVDGVADHVEQCRDCEETMRELETASNDVLRTLRGPREKTRYEQESDCRNLLAVVAVIGHEPSVVRHDEVSAPSEDLGTIRDYQLQAKLGQGGMGTVYKALHLQLQKIVALKVLPSERMKDGQAVSRFHREMTAVGRLSHQNIVGAHDAGEHEGTHYLVMEYVDGVDLSELVHRIGRRPIADACELVRQAAIGLQHAHEHSLVHRDIKPSNLMIAMQGQLKILDLGLARLHNGHHGELTSTGQMMGTIDYMAPEQTGDSRDVDIRADIYGLGATLFKLLCDRAPYADEHLDTMIKKLNALATQSVPSVREHREEVPEELAAIVARMLAKEAEDRYSNPQEVAGALAPFVAGCDLAGLLERAEQESEVESEDASLARTNEYLPSPSTETEDDAKEQVGAEGDQTHCLEKTQLAKLVPTPTAWHKRPLTAVGVALALAGIVAAAVIIRVMTNRGELIVRSEDDNVQVAIRRHHGEPVEDIEFAKGKGQTTLWSGKYEVVITGDNADQFKITPSIVTLSRGGREIVTIEKRTMETVATTNYANSDRRVAEWVLKLGGELSCVIDGEYISTSDPTKLPETGKVFLRSISLTGKGENVGDLELARLGALKDLQNLGIPGARFTDRGIVHLASLKSLTVLHIYSNEISDDGLRHLNSLTNLKFLHLRDTKVTNAGLKHLTSLAKLETVIVDGTKVNATGVAELQKVLPHCNIIWDGAHHGSLAHFDNLRRENIDPYELAVAREGDPKNAPPELVAIYGDSRLREWEDVTSCGFSVDDSLLVSRSSRGIVRLWETSSGRQVQVWPVGRDFLSRDGSRLAVVQPDGTVVVWDLTARRELWSRKVTTGEVVCEFSSDNKLLAAVGDKRVLLLKSESGDTQRGIDIEDQQISLVRFQNQTSRLLLGGKNAVRALDLQSGKLTPLQLDGPWKAISRGGKYIVTKPTDETITLWDAAAGEKLHSLKSRHRTFSFNADDTLLQGSHDELSAVWDVADGKTVLELDHPGIILGFSPDRKTIASGDDWSFATWDLRSGQQLHVTRLALRSSAFSFSREGNLLATTGRDTQQNNQFREELVVRDVESLDVRTILPAPSSGYVHRIAMNSDGRRLALGFNDGTTHIVEGFSGAAIHRFSGVLLNKKSPLTTISPDGQYLVTGRIGGHTIELRDANSGEVVHSFRAINIANAHRAAFSPDSKLLALSDVAQLTLWNLADQQEAMSNEKLRIVLAEQGKVLSLAFSPDGGALAIVRSDGTTNNVNPQTGELERTIGQPGESARAVVCYSSDGRTLAFATPNTASLTLYSSQTGDRLHTLIQTRVWYAAPTTPMAFSPDGSQLASSPHDGSIWFWDPQTGELKHKLRIGPPTGIIRQILYTHDGRHLITVNGNGIVYVLRLVPADSFNKTLK